MEKKTRKLQVMMTEEEVNLLHRMLFWDQADGSTIRSMSQFLHKIVTDEIKRRPAKDLQPIKRYK